MAKNNSILKDGLLMSSNDFVDKKKAQTNKSNLLAALEKINKVHTEKMSEVVEEEENKPENNTVAEYISEQEIQKEETAQKQNYNQEESNIAEEESFEPFDDNETEENVETQDYAQIQEQAIINNQANENNSQPVYQNEADIALSDDSDEGKPMLVLKDNKVHATMKDKVAENQKNLSREGVWAGWTAYILFFLPLILCGKSSFCKAHANEGLKINIFDIIGVLFILAEKLPLEMEWFPLVASSLKLFGLAIIALTTITKLGMIIVALCGKHAKTPVFSNLTMIKY